jgi:hypothetical protein
MSRAVAGALLLGLLGLLAGVARAEPPASAESQRHFVEGQRLYQARAYAAAIAEFEVGYRLEPRGEFLYAIGQAQRMNGDCAAAIVSFEAFLRSQPPADHAAIAHMQLARCEAAIARLGAAGAAPSTASELRKPAGEPKSGEPKPGEPKPGEAKPVASDKPQAAETQPAATAPAPTVSEPRVAAAPERRRGLTIGAAVVAGVALGALASGAGLRISVQLDYDRLASACAPHCPRDAAAGLPPREYASYALLGAGAALAVADVALWIVARRRGRRLAVAPTALAASW